ncbi:hypothetical protein [Blastococcus haudaquaticus]|uniref:Uncharacterized protein n=1 Tax=Blastococcus haudaquaticus TaxID=1938745 RepID=A0A286GQ96_9ACTN|nr:hypothetical protein [Blastococcus haudaquaticus]SOD97717.1 hypothetical protein SAMN06272739_1593 [Blastococcus haudaquaticus]
MTPATTPPAPGSMTVPFLFGWEVVLVGLVLLVVVAVAFLAFGALRAGRDDRTEWQAWLDARSSPRPDPATDGHDRVAPRG